MANGNIDQASLSRTLALVGMGYGFAQFIDSFSASQTLLTGGLPGLYAAKYAVAASAGAGPLAAMVAMATQVVSHGLISREITGGYILAGAGSVASGAISGQYSDLDTETSNLGVQLPGGGTFDAAGVAGITSAALMDPNLNETTFDNGLSTDLPDGWSTGYGTNPYKFLGAWRALTYFDAAGQAKKVAFKFGVPGMVPTIDGRPEIDYPLLECNFPRTLVPDVIIPSIRVPEKAVWV